MNVLRAGACVAEPCYGKIQRAPVATRPEAISGCSGAQPHQGATPLSSSFEGRASSSVRGRALGALVWLGLVAWGALLPAWGQLSAFTEEAVARGIDFQTVTAQNFGYGVGLFDIDLDGDPDAIVFGGASGAFNFYENDGTGMFTNRTANAGVGAQPAAAGISAADYDADGDLDLFITRWNAPNELYTNTGDFTFVRTPLAGIISEFGPSTGSTWADFNGDGWLDLYVGNWTIGSGPLNIVNKLYQNNGDGTFTEVHAANGLVGNGSTFQATFFDHDADGDLDLYVSNDKCYGTALPNKLYEFENGVFTDISASSGAGVCIDSMGLAVGDFDGDRQPDLYLTNIPAGNPMLLRTAEGHYQDEAASTGTVSGRFGWGTRFLDFDNDTYQELYVCNITNPNRLYDHAGTFPCLDVAPQVAVDDAEDSYGLAVADIDNDGDLDMLVSNMPGPIRLYINHEGSKRNWVKFEMVGEHPNLHAIGGKVELRIGSQWQLGLVRAGTNYKSQEHRIVHFGLGSATQADEITVLWPNGATRTLTQLPAGETWKLFPPALLGDSDSDGDNDLDDFAQMAGCVAAFVPGCEVMDFDGNSEIDANDAASFTAIFDGDLEDCNVNGQDDLIDIIAGVSSDVNLNAIPDDCEGLGSPVGGVPNGGALPGTPLTADKLLSGELQLGWGASCTSDPDYSIYVGTLEDFTSHAPLSCSTSGLTSWSGSIPNDSYFLVVPFNGSNEGSYGTDSQDLERPAAAAACRTRVLGSCP